MYLGYQGTKPSQIRLMIALISSAVICFPALAFMPGASSFVQNLQAWRGLSITGAPTARWTHTTAWSGTEMYVWGGDGGATLNTGARYNPSTNTWSTITTTGAPSARADMASVWTGSKFVVWGGRTGTNLNTAVNSGGRFDGTAWTNTSTVSAPGVRSLHSAVWTGSEMIVWGGQSNGTTYLANGGRYNPIADSWTSMTAGSQTRSAHTAVWTGTQMIVWGGYTTGTTLLNNGDRWTLGSNTWAATSTSGPVPSPRHGHTAIWTGSKMIVWGGYDGSETNDGGIYDPVSNSWTAISTTGAPTPRMNHIAVWTGRKMVVWGGSFGGGPSYYNDGGIYDPMTDTWIKITSNGAPAARELPSAVWTGAELLIWGGADAGYINTGARLLGSLLH